MKRNGYAILLTATILPGSYATQVSRADPAVRLRDYARALAFWAAIGGEWIDSLIFCDNSGADLAALRSVTVNLPMDTELLGFSGNDKPTGVHYGYAELGTIDYALQHSRLMARSQYFIKVTGRLSFPQIGTLLDRITQPFDAVVDHRARYRHESGPSTRARTQLMLFGTDFYRSALSNCRSEMIGHYSHIEEFLAAKLDELEKRYSIVRRFPVECAPAGVAGNGKSYQSLTTQLKNSLRAVARYWLPALWL